MILILAGFAIVAIIDLPPLIRKRSRADIAAFLLLFTLALALAFLLHAGVKVPSTMAFWKHIIKELGLDYSA